MNDTSESFKKKLPSSFKSNYKPKQKHHREGLLQPERELLTHMYCIRRILPPSVHQNALLLTLSCQNDGDVSATTDPTRWMGGGEEAAGEEQVQVLVTAEGIQLTVRVVLPLLVDPPVVSSSSSVDNEEEERPEEGASPSPSSLQRTINLGATPLVMVSCVSGCICLLSDENSLILLRVRVSRRSTRHGGGRPPMSMDVELILQMPVPLDAIANRPPTVETNAPILVVSPSGTLVAFQSFRGWLHVLNVPKALAKLSPREVVGAVQLDKPAAHIVFAPSGTSSEPLLIPLLERPLTVQRAYFLSSSTDGGSHQQQPIQHRLALRDAVRKWSLPGQPYLAWDLNGFNFDVVASQLKVAALPHHATVGDIVFAVVVQGVHYLVYTSLLQRKVWERLPCEVTHGVEVPVAPDDPELWLLSGDGRILSSRLLTLDAAASVGDCEEHAVQCVTIHNLNHRRDIVYIAGSSRAFDTGSHSRLTALPARQFHVLVGDGCSVFVVDPRTRTAVMAFHSDGPTVGICDGPQHSLLSLSSCGTLSKYRSMLESESVSSMDLDGVSRISVFHSVASTAVNGSGAFVSLFTQWNSRRTRALLVDVDGGEVEEIHSGERVGMVAPFCESEPTILCGEMPYAVVQVTTQQVVLSTYTTAHHTRIFAPVPTLSVPLAQMISLIASSPTTTTPTEEEGCEGSEQQQQQISHASMVPHMVDGVVADGTTCVVLSSSSRLFCIATYATSSSTGGTATQGPTQLAYSIVVLSNFATEIAAAAAIESVAQSTFPNTDVQDRTVTMVVAYALWNDLDIRMSRFTFVAEGGRPPTRVSVATRCDVLQLSVSSVVRDLHYDSCGFDAHRRNQETSPINLEGDDDAEEEEVDKKRMIGSLWFSDSNGNCAEILLSASCIRGGNSNISTGGSVEADDANVITMMPQDTKRYMVAEGLSLPILVPVVTTTTTTTSPLLSSISNRGTTTRGITAPVVVIFSGQEASLVYADEPAVVAASTPGSDDRLIAHVALHAAAGTSDVVDGSTPGHHSSASAVCGAVVFSPATPFASSRVIMLVADGTHVHILFAPNLDIESARRRRPPSATTTVTGSTLVSPPSSITTTTTIETSLRRTQRAQVSAVGSPADTAVGMVSVSGDRILVLSDTPWSSILSLFDARTFSAVDALQLNHQEFAIAMERLPAQLHDDESVVLGVGHCKLAPPADPTSGSVLLVGTNPLRIRLRHSIEREAPLTLAVFAARVPVAGSVSSSSSMNEEDDPTAASSTFSTSRSPGGEQDMFVVVGLATQIVVLRRVGEHFVPVASAKPTSTPTSISVSFPYISTSQLVWGTEYFELCIGKQSNRAGGGVTNANKTSNATRRNRSGDDNAVATTAPNSSSSAAAGGGGGGGTYAAVEHHVEFRLIQRCTESFTNSCTHIDKSYSKDRFLRCCLYRNVTFIALEPQSMEGRETTSEEDDRHGGTGITSSPMIPVCVGAMRLAGRPVFVHLTTLSHSALQFHRCGSSIRSSTTQQTENKQEKKNKRQNSSGTVTTTTTKSVNSIRTFNFNSDFEPDFKLTSTAPRIFLTCDDGSLYVCCGIAAEVSRLLARLEVNILKLVHGKRDAMLLPRHAEVSIMSAGQLAAGLMVGGAAGGATLVSQNEAEANEVSRGRGGEAVAWLGLQDTSIATYHGTVAIRSMVRVAQKHGFLDRTILEHFLSLSEMEKHMLLKQEMLSESSDGITASDLELLISSLVLLD